MTKQEVKQMTEQVQESNEDKDFVDELGKDNWRKLLRMNHWEEQEDGKSFLRVN
jgi:hypothetical protein